MSKLIRLLKGLSPYDRSALTVATILTVSTFISESHYFWSIFN